VKEVMTKVFDQNEVDSQAFVVELFTLILMNTMKTRFAEENR
jgi:hypothetical protein